MTSFRVDVPTQDGGRQTEMAQQRQEDLRLRLQEDINRALQRVEVNIARLDAEIRALKLFVGMPL